MWLLQGFSWIHSCFAGGSEKTIIIIQWEFQDPKMEVLYHIRPFLGGIFPYIGLI